MPFDGSYIALKTAGFHGRYVIGKSLMGRDIYCIPIGEGKNTAVFAAAFHGLEYLTSAALTAFAEKYSRLNEYHKDLRILIIPMVNPDGVDIALNGIDPSNKYHKNIINQTGIIEFTSLWQANAAGTDINHNFDADWQKVKEYPTFSKYGGKYPFSEPETLAVRNILEKYKPKLFIAFHSQGKEIYYDHKGMEDRRSKDIAEKIAQKVGYTVSVPTGSAAFGGAKDWYIKKYGGTGKFAFTAELGHGKNPLPVSELPAMISDTEKICLTAIKEVFNMK